MNNRSGIAVMVVLFFAAAMTIIFSFMVQSNTNLANQNKQTLYQMQAYYLAHSGMQHAKLKLRLLPKEIYDYFDQGGTGNPLFDVTSDGHKPVAMGSFKSSYAKYDLFDDSKCAPDSFPYGGKYEVLTFNLTGSHKQMRLVQDSYVVLINAEIDNGPRKTFATELGEELIVSRFTGGIQ